MKRRGRSGLGKEGGVILSSMVKAASSFLVRRNRRQRARPNLVVASFWTGDRRRARRPIWRGPERRLFADRRGGRALDGVAPVGQPALLILFDLPDQLSRLAGRSAAAALGRSAAFGRGDQSARRDPLFRGAAAGHGGRPCPVCARLARRRAARPARWRRRARRGGAESCRKPMSRGCSARSAGSSPRRDHDERIDVLLSSGDRISAGADDGLCLARPTAGVRGAAGVAEPFRRRVVPALCGGRGRNRRRGAADRPGQLDAGQWRQCRRPQPARLAAPADDAAGQSRTVHGSLGRAGPRRRQRSAMVARLGRSRARSTTSFRPAPTSRPAPMGSATNIPTSPGSPARRR